MIVIPFSVNLAICIVTRQANRVLPGDIVAAHTRFHITLRFPGVLASSRTFAKCRESRDTVRWRSEFQLIDIPSRLMTFHAEGLRIVATGAIRHFPFGVHAMSETVIQIMDTLGHCLGWLISWPGPGKRIGVEIF